MTADPTMGVQADTPRSTFDIYKQIGSTHFTAFVAYATLGFQLQRGNWNYQHIILPLVFLLYPVLMPCQLLFGAVCALRNWLILRKDTMPGESTYYLSILMGAHHKSAVSGSGGNRIMDRKPAWYILSRKPWSFKRGIALFSMAWATAQCALSCGVYYRRNLLAEPGVYIGFDHRNGWMAFGGGLAGVVACVNLVLGYEWIIPCVGTWQDNLLGVNMPDTSNMFVYESFAAVALDQLLLPIITRRFFPYYNRSAWDTPGLKNISLQALVTAICFTVIPVFLWESLTVSRVGNQHLAKNQRTRMERLRWNVGRQEQRIGILVRILLTAVILSIVIMQIRAEVLELQALASGIVEPWNAGWQQKDIWQEMLPIL